MSDILQKICADKRVHIAASKKRISFSTLDSEARHASPARGFTKALQLKRTLGEAGFIAEIKKASPSAGVIRASFKPDALAQNYARAGASCLSVLTDEPYFQGRSEDLQSARAACSLPVLRKDFMLDVWQIAEARALGADCILLIMAALDDSAAADLHAASLEYGMDVLIENHDEAELERALRLPSGMIGINNRDLKSLHVDLAVTERLSKFVPDTRMVIAESGIKSASDIARLRRCGVNSFLVGESLLKQADVGEALIKLRS